MATIIDLSALTPSQGYIIQGDAAGDQAGWSVSDAGDINGDRVDDFLVGANRGDNGGNNAGEVYIVFGKAAATRANIDLTNFSASDGFIIQGDTAYNELGRSVSSAGDINGDGFDDLIIGAPYASRNGYSNVGRAYVIFGRAGATRVNIDVTSLTAVDGFSILGRRSDDLTGYAVSGAGDVNGDGIDDVLVGVDAAEKNGSNGGSGAGVTYVIFGQTGSTRANIDLTTLPAASGFAVLGDQRFDSAGASVSAAGDVNGDGIDDFIIGAKDGDNNGANAGEAYVIFGKAGTTRATIDLSTLAATDGFIIAGSVAQSNAGTSVSSAGDINGDGFDDLLVGAPRGVLGNSNPLPGEAYVIFGKAGATRTNIDIAALLATDGFIIQGDLPQRYTGISVSAAGDINGDGIDDVIIGARQANDAGSAYVIFGRIGATRSNISVVNLPDSDGFTIIGDADIDNFGRSVSSAGDVNGDGAADLIIGAPFGDDGGNFAGEAYIIYGAASTPPASTVRGGAGGETLSGDAGANIVLGFGGDDVLNGLGGNDTLVGGSGNDSLSGGSGLNELIGGAGDDIYVVAEATDTIVELSGEGADEIQTTAAVMTNRTNVETLRFTGNGVHVGVGLAQNDEIIGGSGVDQLFGRDGNDILRGGSGAANGLFGQGGDDTYYIDAVGDSAIENVGEGTDSVITSVTTLTLRINVENLSYSGNANFTGIGNASDNIMTGNGGDDFLSGLDGNDVLSGGAGLDLLIGGAGMDTFRISDAANADRILDHVSGVDKIALLGTAFTHSATIDYVRGTAATTSNSTFLYISANGVLSYDADGSGAGAAVAIANLGGGLVLSVGDFLFY